MATTNGNNSGNVQLTTVVNASANTASKVGTAYTRAKTIAFVADGLKPNTKYWPFFNDIFVGQYCVSGSGATGPTSSGNTKDVTKFLKTNSQGMLNGLFFLPAQTFTSGSNVFKLVDNYATDASSNLIPDPLYSVAETTYESNYTLKSQQTVITDNSSTKTTKNTVTVNNINNAVAVPPAPICENWYFEYTVSTSKQEFVTQTTNSAIPPNIATVNKLYGQVLQDSTVTVTYVSTEAIGGGTYIHKYRVSSTNETRVLRQEWVGEVARGATDAQTIATLPSLTTFRPTGIGANDIVTIKTGWTKIGSIACPVKVGKKTPVQSDSIAQSFNIETNKYPDGIFVTSIAVYFKTVDQSTPVILELREMSNGIPSSNVLPGGSVVIPGSAAASSPDATVATVFRFDHPIFLQPSNEYCFVLKSSSMGYNVWCSRIGETDTITGKVIDSQQFNGTLFKSDNDVTWVPDGYEDVKFDLYKASFNTNVTGQLKFHPQKNSTDNTYYSTKRVLPLSYISTTKGSTTIKVKIPFHGLITGDSIKIEGITSSYNGFPASGLNGATGVTRVDEDTVTFVGSTGIGSITGSISIADPTVLFDTTQPIIPPALPLVQAVPYIQSSNLSPTTAPGATGALPFPNVTGITPVNAFTVYTNRVINEVMFDYLGTQPQHANITESVVLTGATGTSYVRLADPGVVLDRSGDFKPLDKPYVLLTPSNEAKYTSELNSTDSLKGKSLQATLQLSSSNKDISPLVDINGISLITKTYKIDNQNGEWGATGVSTIIQNQGYVIQTLGTTNWPSLGYDGASGVVGGSFIAAATGIIPGGGYVYTNSEIVSGSGNAAAKYKSTINSLAIPYNNMSIYVTGTCPSPAVFDVYIRTSSDQATHLDNDWVWLPSTESINNNNIFGFTGATGASKEWLYEYPTPGTDGRPVAGNPFTVYDIKIVMRSTNSSIVPKIYSLRTIANNV